MAVLADDAAFLTYNVTDAGWSWINRNDYTVVTNATEGVDETPAAAITYVGEEVYGYDVNGQLFQLNTETFERTNIGDGLGLDVDTDNGYKFVVRDMAYDANGDRVIVLGDMLLWDDYYGEYSEIYGGCGLYVADLTTGELVQIYSFAEDVYVYAMDMDADGNVYYYNTFNDNVQKLDLVSGNISTIITLQSQSMYGDMYCDYAMYYDELTGCLYMLFTSNGNFYKMVTVDTALGTLTDNGYVGEVLMEGWVYTGDYFRGLTFANICEHDVTEYVLNENEDGTYYVDVVCGICGEVLDSISCEIVSEEITVEPTCEEDGTKVITVLLPDGTTLEIVEVIPATGHNYGDDGVCDNCGDVLDPEDPTEPSEPEQPTEPEVPTDPETPTEEPTEEPTEDATDATKPGSNGSADTGDAAHMGLWIALMVMAVSGMAALFTARKKWII